MNIRGQTVGGKTSGETANLTGTAVTFSVLTKTGGPLSKRISLGPDGNPLSDGSACLMITGTATTVSLPFIKFGDVVETLTPQKAIALGTIQGAEIGQELPVVTVRRLREGKAPAGAISRTQDHFGLPDGPGLILIDIDLKGASPKARAAIDAAGGPFEAILTVVPALGAAPRAMRASTSAGLSNPKTNEIWPGSDGLHIYIPVQDAHDIPRSLRALHDRLALNGLGWTLLGRSGAILERSLVDVSVGSPERLIFEGAPVIEPPLIQAPRPVLMVNTDAAPLDTVTGILDLTKAERDTLARMRGQARKDVAQASTQRRKEWAKARGVDIAKRTKGNAKEITEQLLQSGPHDPGNPIELTGVLLLEFDDPKIGEITVSQMMADLERYTGETLADPLEGSAYGRGKAMVMGTDKNGLLRIHSFAHGGMSYFVPRRQRQKFIVSDPHNFDDIADEIADVVGRDKRLFATGGLVVEVSRTKSAIKAMRTVLRDASGEPIRDKGGEAKTEPAIVARSVLAPPGALLSAVLKVATCWKHTRNGELRPVLPPHPLMTLITAKLPTSLPPLVGVTDAPVFWDGRLITGQGYHEPTGLWLETGDLIIEPCHDLADAFVILADWLDGFWFEALIDRVVAVGILLDLLTVKSTLMGTPDLCVGSGKRYRQEPPRQRSGDRVSGKAITGHDLSGVTRGARKGSVHGDAGGPCTSALRQLHCQWLPRPWP
jgi:hypothetical protein